jgi:hypothetical protein
MPPSTFAHQLLGVKSPSVFVELSQLEAFAERTQHLASLTQKVASDAVQPLQTGMKSVLTKVA